jgi:hypothetical protein
VTTIRASCQDCGDVQLRPADLKVRVCADDNSGSYVFACPFCGHGVAKPAEARIVELLVSSGVELEVWRMPAELTESRHRGPVIGYDDLLDFHLLLCREDWFSQLESTVEHLER